MGSYVSCQTTAREHVLLLTQTHKSRSNVSAEINRFIIGSMLCGINQLEYCIKPTQMSHSSYRQEETKADYWMQQPACHSVVIPHSLRMNRVMPHRYGINALCISRDIMIHEAA